jgi:hypothetical protein
MHLAPFGYRNRQLFRNGRQRFASFGNYWFLSASGNAESASDDVQLPAHNFVPFTVPTSLQPRGSLGLTWTSGLFPILGDVPCAKAFDDRQNATIMNKNLISFSLHSVETNQSVVLKFDLLRRYRRRRQRKATNAFRLDGFDKFRECVFVGGEQVIPNG